MQREPVLLARASDDQLERANAAQNPIEQPISTRSARTAADATALLPLSRAGADAVFTRLTGYGEIAQTLPRTDLVATLMASAQFCLIGAGAR